MSLVRAGTEQSGRKERIKGVSGQGMDSEDSAGVSTEIKMT